MIGSVSVKVYRKPWLFHICLPFPYAPCMVYISISTYKTWYFGQGQMLVCIFQHHGSHMGLKSRCWGRCRFRFSLEVYPLSEWFLVYLSKSKHRLGEWMRMGVYTGIAWNMWKKTARQDSTLWFGTLLPYVFDGRNVGYSFFWHKFSQPLAIWLYSARTTKLLESTNLHVVKQDWKKGTQTS